MAYYVESLLLGDRPSPSVFTQLKLEESWECLVEHVADGHVVLVLLPLLEVLAFSVYEDRNLLAWLHYV